MNKSHNQHVSTSRIQDIEILRGIAVIFVVVHHAHGNLIRRPLGLFDLFFSYFGLGIGVDIFFAISGFVITRQLLNILPVSGARGWAVPTIIAFWVRRFWRLLPSAWLWLFLILLATAFCNSSGAFGTFRANYEATIAGVLQVANFRFAETFRRSEYGASFVYWSLSLEEQFYLLFPFLMVLSGKRLPWVLALIAVVQMVIPRGALGLSLRTDALALGALIACWQSNSAYKLLEPSFMSRCWIRWPVFLVLLAFIGSLGAGAIHVVSYKFSLVAVLAAILVYFASYNRGYLDVPAFLRPFILWAGARSYTLYLIHVPAFFLTHEIFYRMRLAGVIDDAEHWVRMLGVFLVIAVVLVEINYRFVEVPCRRYGARLAKRFKDNETENA